MTEKQYIQKMEEIGWDNGFIKEMLQLHADAKKDGIDMPLELDLIPKPIDY